MFKALLTLALVALVYAGILFGFSAFPYQAKLALAVLMAGIAIALSLTLMNQKAIVCDEDALPMKEDQLAREVETGKNRQRQMEQQNLKRALAETQRIRAIAQNSFRR